MKLTVVAVTALLVTVSGCSDVCSDEIVGRVPSPNGLLDALISIQNCGATTDYATQVSIVGRGDGIGQSGTVFISDSNHQEAVRYLHDSAWADVRWLSDERLLISFADKSRVFKSNSRVGDVDVSYAKVGPAT